MNGGQRPAALKRALQLTVLAAGATFGSRLLCAPGARGWLFALATTEGLVLGAALLFLCAAAYRPRRWALRVMRALYAVGIVDELVWLAGFVSHQLGVERGGAEMAAFFELVGLTITLGAAWCAVKIALYAWCYRALGRPEVRAWAAGEHGPTRF